MGWDLHIFKLESGIKSVMTLPNDYQPLKIGMSTEIREIISQHFPNTDWNDPTRGLYDTPDYALAFSVLEEGLIDGFAIHVHGSGDPVTPIIALCKKQGWSLYDTSYGDLIDLNNPDSSTWQAFQEFRNRVIGGE
jgi:hypothetical protein